MFSAYEEALRYLYDNLPMFQRIGPAALKNDLSNTIALCDALGNPQRTFKSIHVAGTNGKGSSSHMIASILQSSGYKTGLYTSPHLKEFTERIRVNGEEISKSFVTDFVNRIRPMIEKIGPSFFEITVAMAFDYFASIEVDVAVIEVGLGGRLDSTNVVVPELSLITNISWDHKEILGDTLEKIASEKAGIIKKKVPVVVSERQPEVEHVFIKYASALHAPIYFASDNYHVAQGIIDGRVVYNALRGNQSIFVGLELSLQGFYQTKNIAGVLQVIDLLRKLKWQISDEHVRRGLIQVISQTGLKGRWQLLGTNPLMVCDTAHNPDGIKEVVRQIRAQSFESLHMVIGVVKDKDMSIVLQLLPQEAYYYFCQSNIPRALDAGLLVEQAGAFGLTGEVVRDVNEAIRHAKRAASKNDMIFIGGSTFVVAEIDNL
ncbi:MAG TPA: folylpolyglutamate synthase/dihydrofolate synthase family protein [Chryseolinea sp.]|nr:folylpolyglutamate synthase/dihydrofolate synthase family protein [Chryseolinea sp.]